MFNLLSLQNYEKSIYKSWNKHLNTIEMIKFHMFLRLNCTEMHEIPITIDIIKK